MLVVEFLLCGALHVVLYKSLLVKPKTIFINQRAKLAIRLYVRTTAGIRRPFHQLLHNEGFEVTSVSGDEFLYCYRKRRLTGALRIGGRRNAYTIQKLVSF